MARLLSSGRDLWRRFRGVADQINTAIERDLVAATQLSGTDHGILSRLAESETKSMRQQQLGELMRWDRTRLSHHLTRMEKRGLVKRSRLEDGGRTVMMTAPGDRARKAADPVHADAVVSHFLSKLTAKQREEVVSITAALSKLD